jgi:hypothetical protein
MSNIIKLPDVRIAFANLWTPTAMAGATGEEAKKLRYGATFIIAPDSPTIALIEERIKAAALEKWKGNAPGVLADIVGKGRICFSKSPKRNKKGEVYQGFEGNCWLSAARSEKQGRPDVFDADKTPLGEAAGRPYNGCYVNAFVDIWADDRYGQRINATLVAVQFKRDGDAFAGGGGRVNLADLDDDVSDYGQSRPAGAPASTVDAMAGIL